MTKRSPKFNWSILDREGLTNHFWQLYPDVCDQELTIEQFHQKLTRHIKKLLPVRVSRKRDVKVDPNWLYIGGSYYSDKDEDKLQCIELIIMYNLFQDTICLSKRRYLRSCVLMADTILHEVMHMRQFRRRNFKLLPDYASTAQREQKRQEQEYLGNSDEIDAYSFNIACELMDKFDNNCHQVIKYLNEDQRGTRRKHNCWRMYLKAFDYDHSHPIIQRVKKKVARYLPHAVNGKPYRNKDWINR